jgi:adenine phosphoribosyltransferase
MRATKTDKALEASDMSITHLKSLVHDIPDFPKPGIVFKDITPLVANPEGFSFAVALLADRLLAADADEILAIESRGFIFGAAVAAKLSIPLQLVRKPGKLPRQTVGQDYELEYGTDRVEVHSGVIDPNTRYAIVDDLIATGGTASATAQLVQKHGAEIACCAFVIELNFLQGRQRLNGCRIESLLHYD